MTINFATVRNSLYTWATANVPSTMPVIYLYNNSPRPTVDYVTLYIASVVQIGRDWIQGPLDNTGSSIDVGDREFTLNLQAYGGDPLTVLENLRSSLQNPSVLDSLKTNGIAYVNWFPITDTTTLIDSRFEQRASLDLLFRIAQNQTINVGNINTVNVEETILNPTGTTNYHETYTIPPP